MKRISKAICIVALCIFILTPIISAHSGKTDSSGGHYDRSTGEYHYHHGYSAHSHYDMDGDGIRDCPYNFKDKTNYGSTSSSSTTTIKTEQSNKWVFGEILGIILKIIGISLLVLLVGCVFWYLAYILLVPLLTWFCKTILRTDVSESTISNISMITIVAIIVAIISMVVLNSEGIL